MKEFISAVEEAESESEYTDFKIDGRELRSYTPTPGQMTLVMATMSRGTSDDQRYGEMTRLVLNSLREEDETYFARRLSARPGHSDYMHPKMIEDVFTFLVGEWFGHRPSKS